MLLYNTIIALMYTQECTHNTALVHKNGAHIGVHNSAPIGPFLTVFSNVLISKSETKCLRSAKTGGSQGWVRGSQSELYKSYQSDTRSL